MSRLVWAYMSNWACEGVVSARFRRNLITFIIAQSLYNVNGAMLEAL